MSSGVVPVSSGCNSLLPNRKLILYSTSTRNVLDLRESENEYPTGNRQDANHLATVVCCQNFRN